MGWFSDMNFWINNRTHQGMASMQNIALIFICIFASSISVSQAKDLYTTDDYLQGLSDEVSDPKYLDKAKQELRMTESLEQSQTSTSTEIQNALISMYNFESLMRTKHPSTHAVYSKLPVSARILIYDRFKSTKKLSAAKRMIIEKYETK